jgi:hypothetical protein
MDGSRLCRRECECSWYYGLDWNNQVGRPTAMNGRCRLVLTRYDLGGLAPQKGVMATMQSSTSLVYAGAVARPHLLATPGLPWHSGSLLRSSLHR